MRTFWLNFHRPYRCRHSLMCCGARWPIPVEVDRARAIQIDIVLGRARPSSSPWLVPAPDAPAEYAGTLGHDREGTCVFLVGPGTAGGAGGCAIYQHRPQSCAHFPFVCLIDPRGVHVTLSHYCPTAASLLFEHDRPIEIVEGPSPVPSLEIPEGLDARESLLPLASPRRLMSPDEFDIWERDAIAGDLAKGATRASRDQDAGDRGAMSRLFEAVRSCVPAPLFWPEAPDDIERVCAELVVPTWDSFAPVVNRYLAAKLFASWAAYLSDGTDAVLREVDHANAVLKVEAARQCVDHARPLDAPLLKQAIRRADLLLLHYADRGALHASSGAIVSVRRVEPV